MIRKTSFLSLALLVGFLHTVHAEEPPEVPAKKWKNSTEASLVSTNGNSNSDTTSAKNVFGYSWSKETTMELVGQALGASNKDGVTAENYLGSEKFTKKIFDKTYLYEKFTWDKDRFAGIRNRYDGSLGFGRLLVDQKKDKLNAELGGGYINEERTDAPRNDYPSGRVFAKYEHIFRENSGFIQEGEYLHNFDDAEGYRVTTTSSISASITSHVGLKLSYQWKRSNMPPPGRAKDDTVTSVALLVNY